MRYRLIQINWRTGCRQVTMVISLEDTPAIKAEASHIAVIKAMLNDRKITGPTDMLNISLKQALLPVLQPFTVS